MSIHRARSRPETSNINISHLSWSGILPLANLVIAFAQMTEFRFICIRSNLHKLVKKQEMNPSLYIIYFQYFNQHILSGTKGTGAN